MHGDDVRMLRNLPQQLDLGIYPFFLPGLQQFVLLVYFYRELHPVATALPHTRIGSSSQHLSQLHSAPLTADLPI